MVFSSPAFLFFFLPAVYIVYMLLRSRSAQNAWLAAASLLFYAAGQPVYVLLLLASVAINYSAGRGILAAAGRSEDHPNKAKHILTLAVCGNLALLGYFKYADFAVGTLNALLRTSIPLPGVLLPIGISFYTFQGMSYVIDVYRDPSRGTKNLGKLMLYISFFPQLIAGPIIKYREISDQIDERSVTAEGTLLGLRRFITGFAKKILLADTMGKAADAVFAMTAGRLDARLAWLGAICYTLQIYFDFSGYSDMAIGLGRLFGFKFAENFDRPYISRSIREFWRRWHISLSSWFRDYLYFPLGGSRKGETRTHINKFIVFFLTGLWHGANWTFVLWGLWHGLLVTLEDRNIIPKKLTQSLWGHVYAMLGVILGFVLFRADTLSQAGVMIKAMFTGFSFDPASSLALSAILDVRTLVFLAAALVCAFGLPRKIWEYFCEEGQAVPDTLLYCGYGALFVLCLLAMAGSTFSPFIYFQF